ncbi:hypothetical protein DTZ28_19325 [Escherichia coli]|uniref:Uncharacterized protein n=1 Tax=Escherichia coli TaxID=562 RepID=A0A2P9EL97_ECOLX|nr:hypothetical protein [Escherichia coli]EGD4827063.1 hypothetical protein [Escherichia coli]EGD5022063.1 hypothetical protein [Escherichia coli]EGD5153076.1 hypothetical protein [Escherichia coli]SPE04151.1 conserved protein of unknown function [Escherichia coli]HBK2818623.1 hypothetical protein [Escherichia coli]
MKHKNFIPKWYDSTLESIPHQDVNTIHSIIDEHHKLWKIQRLIRLVILLIITAFGLFSVFLNRENIFYIFTVGFSLGLILYIIAAIDSICHFLPNPLSDHVIIDRETIQFLIILTSHYPDVQQELFNRLLSGKKLTIHDEREIIDICSRRSATYHLTRSNIPK